MDQLTNRPAYIMSIAIFMAASISGCSTTKPMNDTSTYASMNCQQLEQERAAVVHNAKLNKDAGTFGFTDAFGYLAEGAAIAYGETTSAQQLHMANADSEALNKEQLAKASAYENRGELLEKVMTLRKCDDITTAGN